jgi:hypothetical protein
MSFSGDKDDMPACDAGGGAATSGAACAGVVGSAGLLPVENALIVVSLPGTA